MILYIQFIDKDDIYAVDPFYDSPSPQDSISRPTICGKCAQSLYIPMEVPQDATVEIPQGEVFKPFPTEMPHLIIESKPELTSLSISKNLDYDEIQRLKRFRNMAHVDANGFTMFINDINREPVSHTC